MSTYSFQFPPLGNILFIHTGVFLTPGSGTHRLTLQFDVSASWLAGHDEVPAVAPTLISGTAWTKAPNGLRPLGGFSPRVMNVRGWPVDGNLTIDFTDDELIAIDRAAGQSDIEINLKLLATLLRAETVIHPSVDQELNPRITHTRWLELLDGAGSAVGITLRIPSPLTEPGAQAAVGADEETKKSLSQAAARLRKARIELQDGDWEASIAACRLVLENVSKLATIDTAGGLKSINPQDRTKAQRWAAVFHDINSLANGAHHETTAWTRMDAEGVLACTAALLLQYTTIV